MYYNCLWNKLYEQINIDCGIKQKVTWFHILATFSQQMMVLSWSTNPGLWKFKCSYAWQCFGKPMYHSLVWCPINIYNSFSQFCNRHRWCFVTSYQLIFLTVLLKAADLTAFRHTKWHLKTKLPVPSIRNKASKLCSQLVLYNLSMHYMIHYYRSCKLSLLYFNKFRHYSCIL